MPRRAARSMKSLPAFLFSILALLAFLATLADVASGHTLLSPGAAGLLVIACLVFSVLMARSIGPRRQPVAFVLLGGCLFALATRLGGFETVTHRSADEWGGRERQRGQAGGEGIADRLPALR